MLCSKNDKKTSLKPESSARIIVNLCCFFFGYLSYMFMFMVPHGCPAPLYIRSICILFHHLNTDYLLFLLFILASDIFILSKLQINNKRSCCYALKCAVVFAKSIKRKKECTQRCIFYKNKNL